MEFTFSQHKSLVMFFLFVSCYTGAPTTLADEMIQTPGLDVLKTIKILST